MFVCPCCLTLWALPPEYVFLKLILCIVTSDWFSKKDKDSGTNVPVGQYPVCIVPNRLFKHCEWAFLMTSKEGLLHGVCVSSVRVCACMQMLFVCNTDKVITSVGVSCYCVFVFQQMPGPWVAYGWVAGLSNGQCCVCVSVCVSPCVWLTTWLGLELDLNVHPNYSSPLTNTHTHKHLYVWHRGRCEFVHRADTRSYCTH